MIKIDLNGGYSKYTYFIFYKFLGPNFCPRVNATVGGSSEILVPSGIKETIRVKVDNIAQFIVQTRFVCQFNIEGRVTSVNAQLLGELIYCDAMEFSYTSRAPNISATFAVVWGGSKPLDNPDNIHVLIYRYTKNSLYYLSSLTLVNFYEFILFSKLKFMNSFFSPHFFTDAKKWLTTVANVCL